MISFIQSFSFINNVFSHLFCYWFSSIRHGFPSSGFIQYIFDEYTCFSAICAIGVSKLFFGLCKIFIIMFNSYFIDFLIKTLSWHLCLSLVILLCINLCFKSWLSSPLYWLLLILDSLYLVCSW